MKPWRTSKQLSHPPWLPCMLFLHVCTILQSCTRLNRFTCMLSAAPKVHHVLMCPRRTPPSPCVFQGLPEVRQSSVLKQLMSCATALC